MKDLIKYLISLISVLTEYHKLHPVRLIKEAAARETVEYIQAKMPHAIGLYSEQAVLDYAVPLATKPGAFLEFGVFKGKSIRRIARLAGHGQQIQGFDSFKGLPESWRGTALEGKFSVNGNPPRVPANVVLYKGWFNETLPPWIEKHTDLISFLHIDCDLYSSTKDIFNLLGDRIQEGTVIVFDEYFNYPNWKTHEYKAFQDFVDQRHITYDYIAYSWAQVVVKIVKIG